MPMFADPYALSDEEKRRRQMAAQEFFKQSLPVTRYSYNEQPKYSPLRMTSGQLQEASPDRKYTFLTPAEEQYDYMSQQPMGRHVPYRREQYVAKDKGDGKNNTLDTVANVLAGLGAKALDVALPGAGTAATFVTDAATTGDVKGAAMSAAGNLAGGAAGDLGSILKKSPKTSAAKKSPIKSYYDTDEYKALEQYPTVSFDEFNALSAMNPDERKVEQSRISDRAMALSLAQNPQAGRDAIRLNTLTPEMRTQLGAIGRAGLSAVDENKGPEAMPFRVDPANRAYYAELASLAAKPVQPAQIASPVQMAVQDRGMGGFENYPIVEKSRGFNSYPIVPRSTASTFPSVPAVARETMTSPQQIAAQDLVKQSLGQQAMRIPAMGQTGAGRRMGIDAGPSQQVAENQIYNQMIAPSNVAVSSPQTILPGDYTQLYGGMNQQADAMLAAAAMASEKYNPTAAFDENEINAARLRLNAKGIFEDMMSPYKYQAALIGEIVNM